MFLFSAKAYKHYDTYTTVKINVQNRLAGKSEIAEIIFGPGGGLGRCIMEKK
jgi:hypothetical protein